VRDWRRGRYQATVVAGACVITVIGRDCARAAVGRFSSSAHLPEVALWALGPRGSLSPMGGDSRDGRLADRAGEFHMEKQFVVFRLTNEHYGVDIGSVQGIVKMQPITAVPSTPEFVHGVTNLRGEVLPVIDLRKRFGIAMKDETQDTRIVVAEVSGFRVGMLVDEVTEVLNVADEAVEPAPALASAADAECIEGITRLDERLIILLSLDDLLPDIRRAGLQR